MINHGYHLEQNIHAQKTYDSLQRESAATPEGRRHGASRLDKL